ncbi:hypothetical protein SALBM217S_04364 [Streptomyces griseoloalbus]
MPDAEDVRRIALSLPDTTEKIAWSMPTFRVAGKMFATLPEDETSIAVRCPKEERDELALAEPEKLGFADDEDAVRRAGQGSGAGGSASCGQILADSWRQAAPSRLLEAHPRLGAAAGGLTQSGPCGPLPLMLLLLSSGSEPVAVGVGEAVVPAESPFESGDGGGPDTEVLGDGGEGDVLGLPQRP